MTVQLYREIEMAVRNVLQRLTLEDVGLWRRVRATTRDHEKFTVVAHRTWWGNVKVNIKMKKA